MEALHWGSQKVYRQQEHRDWIIRHFTIILIDTEMCVRNSITMMTPTLFLAWMWRGMLLVTLLRKLSPRKRLSSVLKGVRMWLVACCSASGAFIPPFVILKGVSFRKIYKQDLPAGFEIAITYSGYINISFWSFAYPGRQISAVCILSTRFSQLPASRHSWDPIRKR